MPKKEVEDPITDQKISFAPDREQVLARLWEIANLGPEMTRSSVTGQVKALSMIVAIQNFIPDRHAVSEHPPAERAKPQIYASAWLGRPQTTTVQDQPATGVPEPQVVPGSPAPARGGKEAPPASPGLSRDPGPGQSTFATRFSHSEAQLQAPYIPVPDSVPDPSVPFSIKKNPFARRR